MVGVRGARHYMMYNKCCITEKNGKKTFGGIEMLTEVCKKATQLLAR